MTLAKIIVGARYTYLTWLHGDDPVMVTFDEGRGQYDHVGYVLDSGASYATGWQQFMDEAVLLDTAPEPEPAAYDQKKIIYVIAVAILFYIIVIRGRK